MHCICKPEENYVCALHKNTTELNIVTCGDCGEVFAHKIGVDELRCPYCKFEEDICHFPDLFMDMSKNVIKIKK